VFQFLENQVAGKDWLVGDELTVSDIVVGCGPGASFVSLLQLAHTQPLCRECFFWACDYSYSEQISHQ
jgi:glutathione S-transferase